ncbi:MAG: hypothetical protein K0S79_2756 [Nitrospira sp.]|jgi:hypothetical protein|nr:hypothetical protein [Nitrospira sp.]
MGLRAVLGENNLKRPLAVIARLLPGALPATIVVLAGRDLTALPRIGAMTLFIERRAVAFIVFDLGNLPLAA